MEPTENNSKIFENILFAFLGALSATVLSLASFETLNDRKPAAAESNKTEALVNDFDPRFYLEFP